MRITVHDTLTQTRSLLAAPLPARPGLLLDRSSRTTWATGSGSTPTGPTCTARRWTGSRRPTFSARSNVA
jgi:hypothetical protein